MSRSRRGSSGGTVPPGLADVEVRDAEGRARRLGEAWSERPAVLVWLRHFG